MNALIELIQSDSHAASFQSLGQYRRALIATVLQRAALCRTYLSGPMTGLPEFNFPAFNAAADTLRSEGLTVVNPADHGVIDGWEWADYLRRDIPLLTTCSEIVMLPGWTRSKGALLEHHIAIQLGMVVRFYEGAEVSMTEQAPKECFAAQGVSMGAWAVLASNGNIRAWSEQRDHPTLEKLESEGAAVVRLAWPALDAPALIDGVVVGKGCSTGHVVMISKRKHRYAVETSPEEHARREKAFKDALLQIHEGIAHGAPKDLWVGQEAPDGAKLQRKLEASFQREEQLEREVRELRREKFKRFNGEECWLWVGDGSDKLETLMCPVVISPSDLLEIISRAEPVAELVESLGSMTCAYRMAVQAGYARITALGGDCDSVEQMLADFPDYGKAVELYKAHAAHRGPGGDV